MGAVFALIAGFVNWFPLMVGSTKLPLWLLTMDLVCAKLDLLEMMLQEPSSLPLLEDQDIKESWLVWDRRTLMSEMRLSQREVSLP